MERAKLSAAARISLEKPSDALLKEASFLLGWSKGKPIRPLGGGTTFHSCGKWMTKIEPKTVEQMLRFGLAEGSAGSFRVVKGK